MNRIERLLAPNPSPLTGKGTNTYLVSDNIDSTDNADGAGSASGCIIIDPGPAIEAHLREITQVAEAHGGVRGILVTHGHPDHDEGAARLRELTGAPVSAWSREGVATADRALADGAEITVGTRRLVALHTPGHRFDHLCFWLPDEGVLFAGDLVAGEGTVVIIPGEGDMAAYLASLRRLLALDPRRILPGHGPPIERPRELLEEYIRHRLEREQQVLAALAAGARTPDEIVARVYLDLDPALRPMAALSVTAHLLKLEREGRASRSGQADKSGEWLPPA